MKDDQSIYKQSLYHIMHPTKDAEDFFNMYDEWMDFLNSHNLYLDMFLVLSHYEASDESKGWAYFNYSDLVCFELPSSEFEQSVKSINDVFLKKKFDNLPENKDIGLQVQYENLKLLFKEYRTNKNRLFSLPPLTEYEQNKLDELHKRLK